MSKKQQKMIQSILDLAVSAKVQYNTYLQYSESKALNNFNDKTFIKNNIDPQKIYDDFVNIFTAKIDGLYNWCLLLQIGTVAIYKVWFRNIRFTDNNIRVTDPFTLTNANFADGDINTNKFAGNFNDTYSSENLNIEQIRLVILMKYYTQKCSGSIENIYSVLGKFLSFYYNQHSGLPYNESKNNTFIVADCLVGSEVQYQGVLYIYYNNFLAEQVDAINPEKESEKIKYVLQFSNILPQNIGQSLRFIYANPLPTDEQLLEYSKKPQQVWNNLNVANNLSNNLPENMISKTWCNSGVFNTDYKIVPQGEVNQGLVNQKYGFTPNYAQELPKPTFAETMIDLIDNSDDFNDFKVNFKNAILRLSEKVTSNADEMNDPLAPTRQYMNGIFREIFDNILFYNKGQEIDWSQEIVNDGGYSKGSQIKTYENSNWVVWVSIINNNIEPKPLLSNHNADRWNWIYMIDNFGQIIFNSNIQVFNYVSTSPTKDNYARLFYNYLGFFNKNNDILANYSANGSKAPYYQDIKMPKVIGDITKYGQDTGQNWIKNRILTLAKGTVISMQEYQVSSNAITTIGYAGDSGNVLIFKEIPFVVIVPVDTRLVTNWQVIETTTGHVTIQLFSGQPPEIKFQVVVLAIGTLANYVGDELAKIREYKSSFYYDDLPEDKKLELRQYYIALDETKDLTKVTAPEWLESELESKELA